MQCEAMQNQPDPDDEAFDALAAWTLRQEDAQKTFENPSWGKFNRAMNLARAKRIQTFMTDAEIRGRLLKHFHGLRDANGGWVPTSEIILSPAPVSRQAIGNACQHLAEAGYIRWEPFNPPIEQHAIGRAKITGTGIDVVTGAREPTIDIYFPGIREQGTKSPSLSLAAPSGAISAECRRARFEQWEKLGLDRVKADLASGGHRIIGGPPAVRELAWEWARIKEAEQEDRMARDSSPGRPRANLSVDQMRYGIERLKNRIADLEKFDVSSIVKPNDPRIQALETSIDETLERVFGAETTEWKRYRLAACLHKQIGAGLLYAANGQNPPVSELQREFVEVRDRSLALLDQAIKGLAEEIVECERAAVTALPISQVKPPGRNVFVVHGHDNEAKNEIALFLREIGLEPIILHQRPNGGRHLLTKFTEESEGAAFAVVLMTPDDEGGLAGGSDKRPRARQNVVFELGFFNGKLGPANVAALIKDDVEKPSDFDGIAYITLDLGGSWKRELARELQYAKVPFDPAKVLTA